MKSKIDNQTITVKGSSHEIRSLINEISNLFDNGFASKYLKDKLANLEDRVELEEFKFGLNHAIKYNKDSLVYSPNCSDKAKKFHYNIFKKFFDEAYMNVEHQYK